MARKSEDLQKHTLNLHRGDYDRLCLLFPELGAGPVIRKLVHWYADKCESGEFEIPTVEVDL